MLETYLFCWHQPRWQKRQLWATCVHSPNTSRFDNPMIIVLALLSWIYLPVNSVISFHTRPTSSCIVTCTFATQTCHDFDDVTTAYCLVLRAGNIVTWWVRGYELLWFYDKWLFQPVPEYLTCFCEWHHLQRVSWNPCTDVWGNTISRSPVHPGLEEIPFNFACCPLSFTVPLHPVTSCHEQNCSDMELILSHF